MPIPCKNQCKRRSRYIVKRLSSSSLQTRALIPKKLTMLSSAPTGQRRLQYPLPPFAKKPVRDNVSRPAIPIDVKRYVLYAGTKGAPAKKRYHPEIAELASYAPDSYNCARDINKQIAVSERRRIHKRKINL